MTLLPYQKPGAPEALGLTIADCERAAWAMDAQGRRYRGAGAINAAFSVVWNEPFFLWLYRFWPLRWIQDLAYHVVERNRHRLPGMKPHCRTHPEDCGRGPTRG